MKRKHNCPALRVAMMPKDTNGMGNIFGGVILSQIDIAGAVACRRYFNNRFVTVAFDRGVFPAPVHVGDIITLWADVTKVGNTSVETRVEVEVEREGKMVPVTAATFTYVAVGENGRPTPLVLHKGVRRPQMKSRAGKSEKAEQPAKKPAARRCRSKKCSGGCGQ